MTRAAALAGRIPGVVLTALSAVSAGVALSGGPVLVLWGSALVGGWLLLRRWSDATTALGHAILAFLAIELVLLHVSPAVGTGLASNESITWTVFDLALSAALLARPPAQPVISRTSWWRALCAAGGSILVVGLLALAEVLPGAVHLAWAMNADSVNVIGFARRMLADGGIDQASTPQPTPLPFAMVASNLASGRSALPNAAVLEHDVARMAEVWVFTIALSCVLVGALVARATRSLRPVVAAPMIVLASCLGLVTYFIGVQFDGGFINSAFALLLLIAAWITYLGGERAPGVAAIALLVAAVVLLSVWSPLVACLLGLEVALFVRGGRSIFRNPRTLVALAVAALVLVGYAVEFALPGFVSSSSSLGGDGGFPAIGPTSIFVVVAVTAALACAAAAVGAARHAAFGSLALITTFAIGLGYLLFQRRAAANLWGYYPAKYAWTVSLLLLVMAIAFAVALVVERRPVGAWQRLGAAAVAVVLVSLAWMPTGNFTPLAQLPLAGILTAGKNANVQASTVFRLSGTRNGNDVLWRSAEGDYWPNYWLLQVDVAPTNVARLFSSSQGTLSVEQMCALIGELGGKVIVHTGDPTVSAELHAACGSEKFTVRVDA